MKNFDKYAAEKDSAIKQYTWKGVAVNPADQKVIDAYKTNSTGKWYFYLNQTNSIGKSLNNIYTNLNK